ncbi:MAG: recombination protein RecR [Chlamydiae bacterium CG10_big_fil_rev_8_21_14_0_10_35_9]|nr:MAG: recombination protein RecR [Chlamydiae bacterium CG10_big_fil_rev_8_21_14_0_10_35_9]
MKLPVDIQKIIHHFKKLPGIGSKSAERFAFHLLQWKSNELSQFSDQLKNLQNIKNCPSCRCLIDSDKCFFCKNPTRDPSVLCVISTPKDVFAIEQTNSYKGLYYVFAQTLSPIEDKYPDPNEINNLRQLILNSKTKEVLLALDATLSGDATSLFLKEQLKDLEIKISRLAFGVPIGSSLEFIDEGTLTQALIGRQSF